MRFCSNCGKSIEANTNFCNSCGTQLASNSVAQAQKPNAATNVYIRPKVVVIVLIAIFVVMGTVFIVTSFSGSSIVGTWAAYNSFSGYNLEMTFHRDGSFSSSDGGGTSGTYFTTNNQLMLFINQRDVVYDYSIRGNTLTLTINGRSVTLLRR